jgi:hypothetical protein
MDWGDAAKTTDRGDMTPLDVAEAGRLEEALAAHAGRWVSFQPGGVETLGLDHDYSNEATPKAVYGFEVDLLLPMLRGIQERGRKKGFHYLVDGFGFVRREAAFTYAAEGPMVFSDSYTGVLGDLEALRDALEGRGSPGADVAQRWLRSASRRERGTGCRGDAWLLVNAMDKMIDAHLGLRGDDPFLCSPEKPGLWNEMFRELGYAAFVDRDAVLTGDLRWQTAVFDAGALRGVERMDNPAAISNAPPPGRRFG